MTVPEPGWTTEVEYIRPIDGDTIEVEVRRRFNVRLRDIDVYEISSDKGIEALDFVDGRLIDADKIILHIPSNNPTKLIDFNSFERAIGDVYVDGVSLSTLLRTAGYEKTRQCSKSIF